MKFRLIIILLIMSSLCLKAQDKTNLISKKINDLKQSGFTLETVNLFDTFNNRELEQSLKDELQALTLVTIDNSNLEKIRNNKHMLYNIPVPLPDRSVAQLNLIESSERLRDYTIRSASGAAYSSIRDNYVLLRGEVEYNGVKGIAVLTISDTEISGMFSLPHLGNFTIGKLKSRAAHVIYKDTDLVKQQDFICSVEDQVKTQNKDHKDIRDEQNTNKRMSPCVNVYVEVGFQLFTNRGSVEASEAYMIGLFNQVGMLFEVEGITIDISEIVVWDTEDPYAEEDTAVILNGFRSILGNNFNGDMAHLIDADPGGRAGRAGVDRLCNFFAHAYSSVDGFFNEVNTYSWTVNVVTHETGHILGSPHTHDCAWGPDKDQQIDDCGSEYFTTISDCDSSNTIIPSNGGTIMSYCHAGDSGINFSLGFGQEPGDCIRDRVSNANCLGDCACTVTLNPDFDMVPSCTGSLNLGYRISVSIQEDMEELDNEHWWALYETDTPNTISDDNTISGPIQIQYQTSAIWDNIDVSKSYYVKHGTWNEFCSWKERRKPVKLVAFHYEDKNYNERNKFCLGEDVYIDATATANVTQYHLDLWIIDDNGVPDWTASVYWELGNPGWLNINDTFNNYTFQPDVTYRVKLAIDPPGPACDWIEVFDQDFVYTEEGSTIGYHYEDVGEQNQNEFCLGEDVYLDASETIDVDRYFMSLWVKNQNDDYNWIIGSDWVEDNLAERLNITDYFEGLTGNPNLFQADKTYAVKLSIMDPVCGQVSIQHDFRINNCCGSEVPTNLQFSANTLTWDPVENANGYMIETATTWPSDCSCSNPISIIPVSTMVPSYSFSISPDRCSALQVRVRCADNTMSDPSDPICVRFGLSPSNNTIVASISPNPNNGKMHLRLETQTDIQNIGVEVYDFNGIIVTTLKGLQTKGGVLNYDLDLSTKVKKGIYFFMFRVSDEIITKQVIIH